MPGYNDYDGPSIPPDKNPHINSKPVGNEKREYRIALDDDQLNLLVNELYDKASENIAVETKLLFLDLIKQLEFWHLRDKCTANTNVI